MLSYGLVGLSVHSRGYFGVNQKLFGVNTYLMQVGKVHLVIQGSSCWTTKRIFNQDAF